MSEIEWLHGPDGRTAESWNFVVGCEIESAGCRFCYAMTLAANLARRFGAEKYSGLTDPSNSGPVWNGQIHYSEKTLLRPLTWSRKRRRAFVNSMGDLYYRAVPELLINRSFAVMDLCRQHEFIVLTKRSERQRDYMDTPGRRAEIQAERDQLVDTLSLKPAAQSVEWPPRNVLQGVSVESPKHLDRLDHLRDTPAAWRLASIEPQLEAIDLAPYLAKGGLDWVIGGGESGPGARPYDLAWGARLAVQCDHWLVPYFQKQIGARPVHGGDPFRVRDAKGGDPAEWPSFLKVRQWPRVWQEPADRTRTAVRPLTA